MTRIAIAGISTESSSFSQAPTTAGDFTVWRGRDMLRSGRYPFLDDLDAEFIPLLFANSLPGGQVEAGAYVDLRDSIVSALSAASPIDGVYLDLHGAMKVMGMEDAEANLVRAVRRVVRDSVLISASMDLHGNISQAYIDSINMLTAYRTAPHRDTLETRHKACRMLVDALELGIRPQIARVGVPMLLPGEATRTDMDPGRRIWGSLDQYDTAPGVLDASLFVGFAWVDEERAQATAVVSGTDGAAMGRAAREIAASYWAARHEFNYGVTSGAVDECIEWALADQVDGIFLSDSGDNVTAGAPGDSPILLERLLAHRVDTALVASIADTGAVAACLQAGVGAHVTTTVGGKLDRAHARPLPIRGWVRSVSKGLGQDGLQVLLSIDGVDVVLTEKRSSFTRAEDFQRLRLDPLQYKVVVVKLGYLFPELLEIATKAYLVLSPGVTDLNLRRLSYQHIRRPMFPLDPDMVWSPPE